MNEDIPKRKRCNFFCYEGVVENRNVRQSVKSQDFELQTFFLKGKNIENIAELESRERGFYIRAIYILFILAT